MSGPRIDRAEQDPFGILAGDLDLGLLAAKRPGVAQRREPAKDRSRPKTAAPPAPAGVSSGE